MFYSDIGDLIDGLCDDCSTTTNCCSFLSEDHCVRKAPDGKSYAIEVSVPGFSREEIKVKIAGLRVEIDAHKKKQEPVGELIVGSPQILDSFALTLHLPKDADPAKGVKSQLVNGILLVTVPIKQEEQPLEVEIN